MMTDSVLGVQESSTPFSREGDAARALHDQLVAYAHFVAGDPESRSGVCSEHSYARVSEASGAGAEVRELLSAAPPPSPPSPLDIEHMSGCVPPALPFAAEDHSHLDLETDAESDVDEEDSWEERVIAQAPNATHSRLANVAIDALRELRLARLAYAGTEARGCRASLRREQARAAARRLRRELAPLWAGGRAAAWLHGALCGALPRRERALYEEVVTELRRSVPRLAERLSPHGLAVPPDPLEPIDAGAACDDGEGSPLLVWVSGAGGGEAADARWLRRLRPLLETREVRAAPTERRLGPERWCAASAAAARSQLEDLLAEAGERLVVLGGCGAGAALAAALAAGGAAGGARVRALLLLAPPLLTAEGARDEPDDILHELRMPMLVVMGGGDAACGRGAAAELCERGARRLVVLGGADGALRVPPALRRRLRLPQHALDAAVVDECARWVRELQQERRERQERTDRQPAGCEPVEERTPPSPPAHPAHTPTTPAALPAGTRIVSRSLAGTPLTLPPPLGQRRAPAPPAAPTAPPTASASAATPALDAADILQLPIVFADDEPPAFAPAGARGRLTRVIVARRARTGPARRPPRPARPVP